MPHTAPQFDLMGRAEPPCNKTYPGEHEAIIDKKTWDKAQELLAFNLTHSGKKASVFRRSGD